MVYAPFQNSNIYQIPNTSGTKGLYIGYILIQSNSKDLLVAYVYKYIITSKQEQIRPKLTKYKIGALGSFGGRGVVVVRKQWEEKKKRFSFLQFTFVHNLLKVLYLITKIDTFLKVIYHCYI